MQKNIVFALLVFSLLCNYVHAENIVNGVDLDNLNWERICSNMASVVLETPVLSCEVSHPASSYHRYKVIEFADKNFTGLINCDYLKDEFEYLKQPLEAEVGAEWNNCSKLFEASLKQRLMTPDEFTLSVDSWMNNILYGE